MKTFTDLKRKIPDSKKFFLFLNKNERIIDKGRLAEYYCSLLFNIKLSKKINELYDGTKNGKRIEIKYRLNSENRKHLSGMKINFKHFDYLYYVCLNDKLIPTEIFCFDKKKIKKLKNNRVSFDKSKGKMIYIYKKFIN